MSGVHLPDRKRHRQSHNGQFVICRHDGQQWPCPSVRSAMDDLESIADRAQFICPDCADFVWMQVQSGEMWCPNGHCRFYASQFSLLDMVCDPERGDVLQDMAALA